MVWFKVDDGFHSSRKLLSIRRGIRLECAGLWVIAGSWSAHEELDGLVPGFMVEEFGGTPEHVAALVESGLWSPAPEGAVQFTKWTEYQPTRADLEAEREKARERMRRVRANNTRTSEGTQGEVRSTRPVPSRPEDLTVTTESSHVADARHATDSGLSTVGSTLAAQAGLLDVEAIRARILERTGRNLTADRAVTVARWLLAKSKDPNGPRSPQRYVVRCINLSPAEVQQYIDEGGLAA